MDRDHEPDESSPTPTEFGARAFFVTAPLAVVGAGLLLLGAGADALRSGYAPTTLLLTHLGTLGFLGMSLFGLLYARTTSWTGATLPWPWLRHVTYGSLGLGLLGLALVLGGVVDVRLHAAFGFVEFAALLVIFTIGWALLRRSRARDATTLGLIAALAALLVVVALGTVMERALSGDPHPGSRALWLQVHLSLALIGWLGGLIIAASWRVVPTNARITTRFRVAWILPLAVGILLPLPLLVPGVALLVASLGLAPDVAAAIAAAPAAVAVWLIHPAVIVPSLVARVRVDPDAAAWVLGLLVAPFVLLAAGWAALGDDPRAPVLFGWLAIWGWAGLVTTGLVGSRGGRAVHTASLVVGGAAILTGNDALAHLTGGLVTVTGLAMIGTVPGTRSITGRRRGPCSSRPVRRT